MTSFSISYIFKMVDQFTGPASKLGQAAQQMSKGVHQAGAAATTAAGSIDKVGASAAGAAAKIRDAAGAVSNWVREMARAASVKPLAPMLPGQNHRGAAWSIAQRNAAEEAAARKAAGSGGGGNVVGFGGTMMNVAAGYWMAKHGIHAVDAGLTKLADVDTMRRKLEYSWGSSSAAKANAAAAVEKAKSLSGKFQNTTVAENLHIIDDLRANLPEKAEEIIAHTAEPFVKLHSFFKGWQGGKHAGSVGQSLKDIGIAIRSGELGGNVTGELIKQWAEQLAVSRAWFGDKFKLDEFFKAQKAARYSLPGTSDRFKSTVFPAMVQTMGVGAGVASATAFNKLVAGLTVHQGTAEAWRDLGLVDMDKVKLARNGKIDPSSLSGAKDWIKGGQLYATDPDYFVTRVLLPALANKGSVKGLTPEVAAKVRAAYDTGDVDTLAHLLPTFVKDPSLIKALAPLGKDRNAVQQYYMMIERLASFARDAQGMQAIKDGKGEFDSYDMAKQRLAAQADKLVQTLSGNDFMGNVNNAINKLAGFFDSVERPLNKFYSTKEKMEAETKANAEAARLAPKFDAAWMAGHASPGGLFYNPMEAGNNAYLAQGRSPFANFARPGEVIKERSWFGNGMRSLFGYDYSPSIGFDRMPDMGNTPMLAGVNSAVDGGKAASTIPHSIAVSVEPIRIEAATARVEVNVTGTVNGPVNGSGSGEVQFGSTTTRGTATPDAGAPAGQAQ